MQYRNICGTDINISEIGLGCWTMGGPAWEDGRPKGWAGVDEKEVVRAVGHALDKGVNHFDNADVYGDGAAERLLAKALGERGGDAVISSKVGHFKGTAGHAYEPLHIRHQCEQSLANLGRERIDIYYFHHGDFGKGDCYLDEACEIMERLKEEGKIRCVGLSAYSSRDFTRLVPRIRPSVVQGWAHLMDCHFISQGSPLMKLCESYRMSFVAFSPLNQGILAGKYSSARPPSFPDGDHRQRSEKFTASYIARAESGLEGLYKKFGSRTEDTIRVALQFVLYHKNVAGVIPGFRNLDQVSMNLSAAGKPLKGDEVAFLRKVFSNKNRGN